MAALDHILERHSVWRGGRLSASASATPTGFEALDRELPGGGWPRGTLTELLVGRAGIGELRLVLPALAALSWAGRRIAWLAPPHLPYAPGPPAAGIDVAQLALVRAPARRDALWAAEQVLRSASCHALVAWLPRARYDELRRLAVAAESGRAWVALFRPATPACACLRPARHAERRRLAVAAESSRAWVALFRPPEAAQAASPAALRMALEPASHKTLVRNLK